MRAASAFGNQFCEYPADIPRNPGPEDRNATGFVETSVRGNQRRVARGSLVAYDREVIAVAKNEQTAGFTERFSPSEDQPRRPLSSG